MSRVRFSPGAWKFPLSRASMVSPPSKLKMFTGSVCVLLTSVSLKLMKIKIQLIYATTSSWEKKQNGGWKLSDADWFYFSFYDPSWLFLWSVLILVQFYVILIFLFDPSRSGTCLAKTFVWPVPKISHVMMKWCRRASHLGRFVEYRPPSYTTR